MSVDERLRWHVSWWRPLVLWPWLFGKTFRHKNPVPDLQVLREMQLSYTLTIVIFGTVPALLAQPKGSPSTWTLTFAAIAILVGFTLARYLSFKYRAPADAPSHMVAAFYRTHFLTEAALASTPAGWGMMNTFMTGWSWPCLLGGLISLVWLWVVGPTSTHIRRLDRRLRARGATGSLIDGLTEVPSDT